MLSVVLVSCGSATAFPASSTRDAQFSASMPGDSQSFVSTSGTQFTLDGNPFRFIGVNIYDAAATDRYSCNGGARMSGAQLADTLRRLHDDSGVTVLRFWAYQTYTQAGLDFSGMDEVIAIAKRVGIRLLPVLEDGPGNCTTSSDSQPKAKYQGDTWFSQGYRVPYGNASLSYRDYVKLITDHYRDEPTILGWSMINEADTAQRDSQGRSVLLSFAQDIAGVIRSVDTHHLITVGTQGNGAPGASGPDFRELYSLPDLDFSEVHDWGYWGSDSAPMPGGNGSAPPDPNAAQCQRLDAPIGCSFAVAPSLNKPLVVGEAGIQGRNPTERTTRAERLGDKINAAFAAGASGYLLWQVNTKETDGYDILMDNDDPVLSTMAVAAAQWAK